MKSCKWYRKCPMKGLFEAKQINVRWVATYCFGDHTACVRYLMEQRGESHPDWMLPDGSILESLRPSLQQIEQLEHAV